MPNQPANGQPNSSPPGITRIAVSGFKSLANKVDVEIRPLTVLAGANSSGKSALMQPLLLMKQTLESDVVPAGPFLLSGPYTRYTETGQFLSRAEHISQSLPAMSVDFELGGVMKVGMTYLPESEIGLEVKETRGENKTGGQEWRIKRDSTSEELQATLFKFSLMPLRFLMERVNLAELTALRSQFYLGISYSRDASPTMSERGFLEPHENLALNAEVRRILYVPGLRGDQHRKWLLADVSPIGAFEGPFEAYAPTIIYGWQRSRSDLIHRLIDGLRWLDLASGIGAERLNESELELYVPRTLTRSEDDLVNIADVGLAVPTVLPVLVAIIQADPGQLIYIEQPELHLHPRAQWKLAQLLAEAANRGVRLVIETHSSLLLQGILTQVARGGISRENVALHWFARNEEGITKVTTADVDAEGRFGDWPADFDDVELKATNDYLDAVETKLMERKGAA